MTDRLEVGDKIPDFTAPCVWCGEFTLSSKVRESQILFYFYPADFGMQCTYYSEAMNDYHDGFGKIGVKVFHVNPDTVENHIKYMDRLGTRYDHISDAGQKVSRMFGMVMPSPMGEDDFRMTNRGFALVDENMVLRYIWRAPSPINTLYFEPLIETLREILEGPGSAEDTGGTV